MALSATAFVVLDAGPSRAPRPTRYRQVHQAADQLACATQRGEAGEIQWLAAEYLALVSDYAGNRAPIMRGLFLASLFGVLAAIDRKCPMPAEARAWLADELVDDLEEAATSEALVSQFHRVLRRLSVMGTSTEGPRAARVHAAMNLIHQQLTTRMRLPMIARKAGFSVAAFVRAFKQTTGISFVPYVRGKRLELAKTLLAAGVSVNEAAVRSGFESQPNLARAFKVVLGETPSEYRARTRVRTG